jgi:two-component system, cell cycle sensor histidine kinase and response regulator CckA
MLSHRSILGGNPGALAISWLDDLTDGVAVLDPSHQVLYCNSAFADLFGRSVAELQGSLLCEVLADAESLPFPGLARQVIENQASAQGEANIQGTCWQVRGHPVAEGVLFLLSDVTARRQLEDELIQTAWHARLVQEQLPTIQWTVNNELRFTLSTGAGLARLGLTPDQVVGQTLFEFFQTADRDFYPIRKHLEALEGRAVRYAYEHGGRAYDVVLEPFRDSTTAITGVIGLAHDVTEQRRAQEERVQLQQQFFQAQKLESLGLLAGGIAHDFGNLLVCIQNASELLLRDLKPGSPQRDLAVMIQQAGQRGTAVTRQMLAFAGRRPGERRCIDLNQLIQDNLPLLRSAFPSLVEIHTALDPDLPSIHAEAGQIQQVVMNLIINAGEAIGRSDGGVIRVTTRAQDQPDGTGRHVFLEVSDTGCGMSPEVQARIFDPFFSTKSNGRGLGLSAVRGILESHHGHLRVNSAAGQGATFIVSLPAHGTPPLPSAGSSEPDRVLYIEDEPFLRDIVTRSLSSSGVPLLTASTGEEAVELFRRLQGSIKLVILDLVMPGMDGWETLKALHQIQPDLKVVLASGHLDDKPGDRGSVQVVGVLPKPYHLASLLDLIHQHCRVR